MPTDVLKLIFYYKYMYDFNKNKMQVDKVIHQMQIKVVVETPLTMEYDGYKYNNYPAIDNCKFTRHVIHLLPYNSTITKNNILTNSICGCCKKFTFNRSSKIQWFCPFCYVPFFSGECRYVNVFDKKKQ